MPESYSYTLPIPFLSERAADLSLIHQCCRSRHSCPFHFSSGYAGLSRTRIYELRKSGEIRFVNIGRSARGDMACLRRSPTRRGDSSA